MPEFGNAFSGLAADRKLTHEELVRAVRFMVSSEYEAVQLYVQLAESTDNELAKRVLMDIADEEIVHAGEFLTLLKELAPQEEALYAQGAQEVREMMNSLSGVEGSGDETVAGETAGAGETAEAAHSSEFTVGSLMEKG